MSNLSKREQLRASQEIQQNTNPAKKFYKWVDEHKKFSWYEKDTKTNILVDLPFRFVTLGRPLFCLKGYNEKIKQGIYSNEVRSVKDNMTVRYFDKNQEIIAQGVWADVKDKAYFVGAKYHLSIYGYDLESKEIINIDIKGNGIGEWGDLFKKCSSRLADEVVIVKGFKEGKTGNVRYTFPTFELERAVSDDELDEVIDALDVLKKFHAEYFKGKVNEEVIPDTAVNVLGPDGEPDQDELGF